MLLTPESVKVSERILDAYGSGHPSPVSEITERTRASFDSDIAIVLPGSGGFGVEFVAANSCSGAKALCLSNGPFGERLYRACSFYATETEKLDLPEGEGFSLGKIAARIEESDAQVLALVHAEAGTGVANKLGEIAKKAKEKGMVTVADCGYSLFAEEFSARAFGVDFACAPSGNALGAPSGLNLIGLSSECAEHAKKLDPRSHYLDVGNYLVQKPESPLPHAVEHASDTGLHSAVAAAYSVLDENGGLAVNVMRHAEGSDFVRCGLRELGLTPVAEAGFHSNAVTAFRVPGPKRLLQALHQRFGIILGCGIGKSATAESTVRVGHLANFTLAELDYFISAMKELASEGELLAISQ